MHVYMEPDLVFSVHQLPAYWVEVATLLACTSDNDLVGT